MATLQGSRLELEIERRADAPALARGAISGLCDELGLTGARCHTLRLLVSELVTNALLHSDAPTTTPIGFAADFDDARVRVEVADGGRSFTHAEAASAAAGPSPPRGTLGAARSRSSPIDEPARCVESIARARPVRQEDLDLRSKPACGQTQGCHARRPASRAPLRDRAGECAGRQLR